VVMVSETEFDVAPQALGLVTVIEAVPVVAIREAGTVAVSCVEETKQPPPGHKSAVPFQFTVEVETKFVPVTVNVKSGPPTPTQVGLIELMVGVPPIVKLTAFDVAPQMPGLTTVIEAVPGVAMLAPGTLALSCVEETKQPPPGHDRGVPFQFTVEVERKFVPFTVNVNALPPAITQLGLSELIEGVLHGVGVGVGVGVNVAEGVGVGVNVAVGVGVNVAVAVGVGVNVAVGVGVGLGLAIVKVTTLVAVGQPAFIALNVTL
jgi:hypothetical protein